MISEGGAALGEHNVGVAEMPHFFDCEGHSLGGEELSFLNIDTAVGFCGSLQQRCLPAQKGWYLQHVDVWGSHRGVGLAVDVGDHRYAETVVDSTQDFQPFEVADAGKRVEPRTVGFAIGGLESVGNLKPLGDGHQLFGYDKGGTVVLYDAGTRNEKEITPFKNSKYVFSDAYDGLPKIKSLIRGGNKVIFVGIPCQVAALRKIIKEDDNVILADLVCHGTTPVEYLRQHITHIERSMGKTTHRMSFRDPEKLTYTFTFALYDKDDNCFYAQRTKDGDTYQYGYHRGISYRENCYHCQYAKPERVSDITLCDYSGLGKLAPSDYGHRKVSCILTNTERGDKFIQNLISEGNIHADLRPVEEPIAGDQRLRGQLPKSKARKDFERLIVENANDFEKTMGQVVRRDTRRMKISRFVQMPKRIARKIKRIIYK